MGPFSIKFFLQYSVNDGIWEDNIILGLSTLLNYCRMMIDDDRKMIKGCWANSNCVVDVLICDVYNNVISEAPYLYLILWNHSQVSGWINELVTHEDYHETLVLEIMEPVTEDKQVSDSGNIHSCDTIPHVSLI